TYIRTMAHTTAVNISVFFGTTGRLIPTSSACVSGSMGIGYAAEAIRLNKADVMIAGGAEEFDIADVGIFDTLFATSTQNDRPELTPRPFDRDRDGLVIGEGACTLILEEYEHAKARGAKIVAEIVGFGTSTDGRHITQPQADMMGRALNLALEDAALPPEAIGVVSLHGTATDGGDTAESIATHAVLGTRVPAQALKSYFGHTLGACGSMEAWLGIEMMREGWFCPTANLIHPDPNCAELDHIMGTARALNPEYLMTNNFAFGGVNTSIILRQL
ncbi:MAG: beta-ketoacyl synthase N-terminal-like domain-containing protein, partial [Rhizomicrobium sp.]